MTRQDLLEKKLEDFANERSFRGKGPLCVALVVTDYARTHGLPIDPRDLLTGAGGQVRGLGRGAVQKILNRHGISRLLASEGGRTSRGSIAKMREYVEFLNRLADEGHVDFEEVERFWVRRVRSHFASQPFKIKLDPSLGLRALVRDLLKQAEDRQREAPGLNCAGAVLQHLVGAKLECALGEGAVEHHPFSAADASTGRVGDFVIDDVAVHVTMSPNEALVSKCHDNLAAGYRPVVVTVERSTAVAEGLARNAELDQRIDIFGIEQFVALNLYEMGWNKDADRDTAVTAFVKAYNDIMDRVENDPSLKIELHR